jgi:glutathione S-transferase
MAIACTREPRSCSFWPTARNDAQLVPVAGTFARVRAQEWLLRERSFVLGPSFSVVDAYAFAITRWCSLPRVMMDLEPYPYIREYMARIADRPAVREALVAEGLV